MNPLILPLGDRALLVRFGDTLTDAGNRAAVALAKRLDAEAIPGAVEVVPNLTSVRIRYEPGVIDFERLAGEVRLRIPLAPPDENASARKRLQVRFDGEDLADVAAALDLSVEAFIRAHNAAPLRILATGFAPGFVYCGFHPDALRLPRRTEVRPRVPAGSVLFASGQTAIASTPIPTGWHLIGHTDFRNFDAGAAPPTTVAVGDEIIFEAVS